MNIHLIWAQDEAGGIGTRNKLPWHISEDLKKFKSLTSGNVVIMGRKTWDSLPIKPLPKRYNYVLSSKKINRALSFQNINQCISHLKKKHINDKIFIIGGASIYSIFYDIATVLHMTIVNKETDHIDTFFPIQTDRIKKEFRCIENNKLAMDVVYKKLVRL